MEAKGLAEGSNDRITEALESFISVDNARVLVTMGEMTQFKDVHNIVPPNKAMCKDAAVVEEEVLTLRRSGSRSCTGVQMDGWPRP